MSLVVFENVSLALGGKALLDALSVRIAESDRIGLVGPNGSGKTSLLRLLAGVSHPDAGGVHRRRGLSVGYLPQDIVVEGGKPLLEFVVTSVPGRSQLDAELAQAEAELEDEQTGAPLDDAERQENMMELAARYADLHERLARFETQFSEHEAWRILAGLGFRTEDRQRDLGELSGGWRMRAVLAALLFQQPDLLLLDEPTNHLDMPSVGWFSAFMRRYRRAFVLVSHDREFLNEQVERIVSFEPEGVRSYLGDYEQYVRQRAEEQEVLERRAENVQKQREHMEKFVERFKAKASKARQAQSRLKQLEKMEVVEAPKRRKVMRFAFPEMPRAGVEVLQVGGLRKAFGDHVVLNDVDLSVRRGERIGIIGVNGSGKTTLLRTLAGELESNGGTIEWGHNVSVAYYAQHHAEVLPPDSSVYDEVARNAKEASLTKIRAALGALLLDEDDVEKKIRVLSGGERARVALARILVNPGNVLLMDEPTNHLDLESSESLASSLGTFDGTLIFVSHNRSFVRALATRIWNVADGKVETYPGTLDEYLDSCRLRAEEGFIEDVEAEAPAPPIEAPKKPRGSREEERERKRKEAAAREERNRRVGPLRKRLEQTEARINELERAQRERTKALEDPALYEDPPLRDEIFAAFRRASEELENETAEWMRMQEELERANDG